jgi:hypothetical protein
MTVALVPFSYLVVEKRGYQDFVVLFDEVEAAVVGDEGGDLLAVLNQLDTNALSDSGVRLLGFDSDLNNSSTFRNNTLGTRISSALLLLAAIGATELSLTTFSKEIAALSVMALLLLWCLLTRSNQHKYYSYSTKNHNVIY